MTIVTIEEAQAKLPELIDNLAVGEELLITRDQRPIARLLAEGKPKREPRKAGSAKGMLMILADDDEHLRDRGRDCRRSPNGLGSFQFDCRGVEGVKRVLALSVKE